MTEALEPYDVAVIGYGPTGATAANLLGRLGLKVARRSSVTRMSTAGPRAISTDEEVMRIWQSVGLADRLQADMLPDRPLTVRRRQRRTLHRPEDHCRAAAGHPPQQFLYQPAVDQVLREGVARFAERRGPARTRMPARADDR